MTDAAAIAWAYTHNLTAVPPARMEFLQRAIAHIHAQKALPLPAAVSLPLVGTAEAAKYDAIVEITRNLDGTHQGVALPQRVLLWECDEDGVPSTENGELPDESRWALDPNQLRDGKFEFNNGRRMGLLCLYYSMTGAPSLVSQPLTDPKPPIAPAWYRSSYWWLGITAALLFMIAAGNLLWTGRSVAQAAALMSPGDTAAQQAWASHELNRRNAVPRLCGAGNAEPLCTQLSAINELRTRRSEMRAADRVAPSGADIAAYAAVAQQCRERLGPPPPQTAAQPIAQPAAQAPAQPAVLPQQQSPPPQVSAPTAVDLDRACRGIWQDALLFASRHRVVDTVSAGLIGRTIAVAAYLPFGRHASTAGGGNVSLAVPMFLMIIGIVGVILALGRGINGHWLGALTNAQGRYSLSIAQATGWTMLLLVPLIAIAMFNAGLIAEAMRAFLADPQNEAGDRFLLFPSMPAELWAVLGISLSSPLLTALILGFKQPVSEGRLDAAPLEGVGKIVVRDKGVAPSIADWFLGENGDNFNRVDISRLQMVLITAGLMMVYTHLLFVTVQDISLAAMLAALGAPNVLISHFPPVNPMMAGLLALSHSTYLVVKAAPVPAKTPLDRK